jgi:predicted Ser/Thr protein kinase
MSSTTRIGTSVAGYRLESLLGRGGMSVVYLAEHVRLGRKVALKLLSAALSEDESFRERFERESRRAAEIDHPNIIPIYDAGEADGQFYIAMRYVEGCDLKALIRRDTQLSVGRTLYILEQAASALDAAHERDLIHRDVKPANILIEEPSERVFLTDFGVVKHTASHGLTKTGFFVGTVDYAAPEQIEGLPVDARTDVYALGCVLYECLAGRAPFDRDAEVAVMHAHLMEQPPSLTSTRPDLPKDLNRVIGSAMAKAKDERYSTCEELVEAARAAALQRGTATARERVPPTGLVETTAAAAAVEPDAPASAETEEPPVAVPAEPEPVAAETTLGPRATDGGAGASGPRVERGGGRRLPPWLLAAVAALVAAAASAVVVYFATRSDSEPAGSAGTDTTQQEATTQTGATTPAELTLETVVPAPLFQECQPQEPASGALESAVCLPTGVAGPNNPDQWEISIYPDENALNQAYDAAFAQAQTRTPELTRDAGRCPGGVGERLWNHPGVEVEAGRLFCYTAEGNAFIGWTHLKRKGDEQQTDHIDLLATARIDESSHFELNDWWRFWHHRIGKLQ